MKDLIRKILEEHKSLMCVDCGDKTEAYFIKDEIWNSLPKTKRKGSMCLSCLEKRTGRKLKKSDFKNSDIHNKQPWWSNLKESEEDDLGWAQDIVNSVSNPIMVDRNESYIISVCRDPINPDEFRYKFEELYGEWNVDERNMNIFKNKGIAHYVSHERGYIIYFDMYDNKPHTGWDPCDESYYRPKYKIFTLPEFLSLQIK
jgi:hypothetical protein